MAMTATADGMPFSNLVVGEGNAGEGAEVASLSLVIIGTPVAVGRSDPSGVGIVGISRIGVVIESAVIENQSLCSHSTDDNAIKGAVLKIHAAQLAPGAGVKLIVKAEHTVKGGALEGYMGVGRNSQQQAGTDVINIGITGSTAGNGTANKNNIFTVGTVITFGAVIFLAKVAIGIVAIQHAAVFSLAGGIIANAIAENTVSIIAIIANGDIHSSAEPFLGSDVGITIHSAKLRQRIGVGLGTITSSTLIGHSGDRQHDGQHKDSQQNA